MATKLNNTICMLFLQDTMLKFMKTCNSKLLTSKKKTHISGTNLQNIPIYIYIALLTPTHPLRQPAGEGANRQQKDTHILPDRYLPTLF